MIFYTHERNFGCRLMEYTYKGLRTISLENELLRVSILADKGTDIFEFLYKPLDVDFMWRSPWGIRNPATFVATSHHGGSAFLDFYEGGWQDCMPTGGGPTEHLGLPFGAHGETPTIPWQYQIVENTPEKIEIAFQVRTYRTPFHVEKRITLERNSAVLQIEERVTNEGRTTQHLMWGQHPALGAPFLDDACVIDVPGARVHCKGLTRNTRFVEGVYDWPLVPGKAGDTIDLRHVPTIDADTSDTIFLSDMPEGWYAVTNRRQKVGFGMTWPREVFPALWFWQVYGGAYDPPWHGRTYNIALEPFSSIEATVTEARANDAAHVIEPGESLDARFCAVAYAGIEGVRHISDRGQVTAT